MTIHNLKFQGIWDRKTIQSITGLSDYYFTPDKLEFKHDASYLKGGLVYADAITTVSNTYAQEIQTPFYGEGLDGLMCARANDLRGIVNGLDYNEWNPETPSRFPCGNLPDVHVQSALYSALKHPAVPIFRDIRCSGYSIPDRPQVPCKC